MIFCRPVNDKTPDISQGFSSTHKGVDYAYPVGTPVYAMADGTVTIAKKDETRQWIANTASDPFPHPRALQTADYGNFVKVDHGQGHSSLCAHLRFNSVLVKVGDQVKKGQKIAEVGSTGNSTGNHTHAEIRLNEVVQNPVPLTDPNFSGYFDIPVPTPIPPVQPIPNPTQPMRQIIIDVYRGLCGVDPSEDEIKYRLTSGINTYDLVRDICNGDSRFKDTWINKHLKELQDRYDKLVKAVKSLPV